MHQQVCARATSAAAAALSFQSIGGVCIYIYIYMTHILILTLILILTSEQCSPWRGGGGGLQARARKGAMLMTPSD